jgi:predicted regulator of Ras-like GTPase activity (Roadblock/LC7/MglB family)
MDNEVYSFALKNTLDEVQKICPDIKSAFALTKDHELLARDETTPENAITRAITAFEEMLEKAQTIGGVEEMTIEGENGRLNVSRLDEVYLVTVTSKQADLNYVKTVTHVLVPTVLRLLEKLSPIPLNPPKPEIEPEEPTLERANEHVAENAEKTEMEKHEERPEPMEETEKKLYHILPEAPVTQFIVEDMKGLLAPSDTVRIDNNIIEEWKELYEDRPIEEAEIETFGGKATRCKVKPIKDPKLDGQGKIQIPSKVQTVLDVKKGELVRVKPAVE